MSSEFGDDYQNDYPFDDQDARKKKRIRLILIAVGVGVLALIACCTLFVGGIVATVFGAIRSTEPYEVAVELALDNPEVVSALGAPVEPGFFVMGSVETSNQSGYADLQIPLKGSTQNGTLYVSARRINGEWQYDSMVVTYGDADQRIIIDGTP